ncbi:MAG: rhodanese-like domain-containing protein [Planctomycetota bacterium]
MVDTLRPTEFVSRRDAGESFVLLDVREPQELAICRVDGALHIPLRELPARLAELDPDAHVVCMCHHGMRSASAAAFLESRDFERVSNLAGGIEAWAREVDPGMARY